MPALRYNGQLPSSTSSSFLFSAEEESALPLLNNRSGAGEVRSLQLLCLSCHEVTGGGRAVWMCCGPQGCGDIQCHRSTFHAFSPLRDSQTTIQSLQSSRQKTCHALACAFAATLNAASWGSNSHEGVESSPSYGKSDPAHYWPIAIGESLCRLHAATSSCRAVSWAEDDSLHASHQTACPLEISTKRLLVAQRGFIYCCGYQKQPLSAF